MPEDTLKYSVELDTQGLAAQLASVRDVVSGGLTTAAQGTVGAVGTAGMAVNTLSTDLMMGQQAIAASFPAQFGPSIPRLGFSATPLAQVPGMPQTFTQEVLARTGLATPPLGVFPSQFQAIAGERLRERIQVGAAEGIGGLGFGLVGMGGGALVGGLLGGPVGATLGGIGGGIVGMVANSPVGESVQTKMEDRARLQTLFGWNSFNSDQRAEMANQMTQVGRKSLFRPEEFNNVLPAAAKAGFLSGIAPGDTKAFAERFERAHAFFQEAQFSLGVFGAEGQDVAAGFARQFRRLGVRDMGAIGGQFRAANVLAEELRSGGDFVSTPELLNEITQAGAGAQQFGVSARRGMEIFQRNLMSATRAVRSGRISEEDLGLMGGSAVGVAHTLQANLMASQRNPLMRMAALALGSVDASGRASIGQGTLDQIASGGMSFSALADRMSQNLGTGVNDTTQMLTLMANQQKLQSDLSVNQADLMRGFTDDLLRQGGIEVTNGTRQFFMQRIFGIEESASRALTAMEPSSAATRNQVAQRTEKLQEEIHGAIKTQEESTVQGLRETFRSVVDGLAKPLDAITRWISEKLVPPIEGPIKNSLESIDRKIGAMRPRSDSPISVGPITFSENHTSWLVPPDPATLQGFRAVSESRSFPAPMISPQVKPAMVQDLTRLRPPMESRAG